MIRFSFINHEVRRNLGLSSIQYLVADCINTLSMIGHVANQDSISESTGLSKNTVSRCLTELVAIDPRIVVGAHAYETTDAWREMVYGTNRQTQELATQTKKIANEVISLFNTIAGTSYRSDTYEPLIGSILRADPSYGLRQFEAVIRHKNIEWKDNPDMQKYLRPSTLFGSVSKFNRYLDEARNYWKSQERANRIV